MALKPLQGNYAAMVAIALAALVPFILLTTAHSFFLERVAAELEASRRAVSIAAALSTAGYCFGALLAGDLVARFPQRRLFLLCEGMFVAGALVAAFTDVFAVWAVGRVLCGLATGLLLIVALPPVLRRFPAKRLPLTVVFINIAFFGGIAGGPLVGALTAEGEAWRWLYVGLAGVGAAGLLLAVFTLPPNEPPKPDLPFDAAAIGLGLGASVLPLWGAAELTTHDFASPWFWAPTAAGLAAFVALLIVEYRKREPLAPVKPVSTTFPVLGLLVAMVGGGVTVALLALSVQFRMEAVGLSPLEAGLSFWPLLVAVLIASALLGLLLPTRWLPLFMLAGLLMLAGAAFLMLTRPSSEAQGSALAAAALIGFGAGCSVGPGLYFAAFCAPPSLLPRIFALLELVRSIVDFLMAPVMVKIARIASGERLTAAGTDQAVGVTLLLTLVFIASAVAIWFAGTTRLPKPDLPGWLDEGGVALKSPPLAARLRG